MREQSKAALRRLREPVFRDRYFVGVGIDVGPGPDPIQLLLFPNVIHLDTMDLAEGDAQTLRWKDGRRTGRYDFLHASHVLEHLVDPYAAFDLWVDSVIPGGHLVVTVPDEDLYEQGHWPSMFSREHLWTFTIYKEKSWSPASINLLDLLRRPDIAVERLMLHREHWLPAGTDQTLGPAECAIEMVLRRL